MLQWFLNENIGVLITEIQSKRQERKRRTTANPVYSGAVFEPEVQYEIINNYVGFTLN